MAMESKNLGPFWGATSLQMELLVRIVLSNYNELWQVRILLPRPPASALQSGATVSAIRLGCPGRPAAWSGWTTVVAVPLFSLFE
jgi:hypothetical protein